jgi:hypothetical protein
MRQKCSGLCQLHGVICGRGLYAATGQREQARAELSVAIDLYRAMDMTFWLPQAEAVLAALAERDAGGPTRSPGGQSAPGHAGDEYW